MANRFRDGEHLMVADCCGMRRYRSEMVQQHDGAWVCRKHVDPKHPQEERRPKVDDQRVDVARPRPTDVFVEATEITRDDL